MRGGFFVFRAFASVGMSAEEEAHISAPEPKRPATGDAEKQPDTSDVHLSEHEGSTKFCVVYNKKPIPLFFNLVSCDRGGGGKCCCCEIVVVVPS